MAQIRLLTSSDEHVSDTNPGFRKDNYRNAILEKLQWQGELGKKANVNAILRGGDFFHHKAANRTSHSTIQQAAAIHLNYGFPTYSLVGNHDMTHNDIDSVFENQPLGVLFTTKVFERLSNQVIRNGSTSVSLVGFDYDPEFDFELFQKAVRKDQDTDYTVAFIHALASYAPSERMSDIFKEPVLDYRDLVYPGCPDVYVFGHYHKDQGIQEHMGVKFINVGSVSRGSLTFDNLERKPKSSLISVTDQGISCEEVELPSKDASEIFDLDLKRKIVQERKSIDEFIMKLKADMNKTSAVDIAGEIKKMPEDIQSLALSIIEAAEAGVDNE